MTLMCYVCNRDLYNPFFGVSAVKKQGRKTEDSGMLTALCSDDAKRFLDKAGSLENITERNVIKIMPCSGTEGGMSGGIQMSWGWGPGGKPQYIPASTLPPKMREFLFGPFKDQGGLKI